MLKILKRSIFVLTTMIVLLIQVYPIFWIFLSSFKTQEEFRVNLPFAFPKSFDLQNYIRAFQISQLGAYFINSFIVTFCAIAGIALLGSMSAFALQKMQFRINRFFLAFFILGIIIPIHITLIPMFIIYNNLNMLNTHISLILPQIGFALPMSIYLFYEFYRYSPKEIFESGLMDGCNIYQNFYKLLLPMSKNTFVTVLTMNAITIWNEFTLSNTFISKSTMKTVPIGLYDYQGDFGMTDWGATFAAIAVTTAPLLILFFLLNKGIISGMTVGAVKE